MYSLGIYIHYRLAVFCFQYFRDVIPLSLASMVSVKKSSLVHEGL